MTLDRVVIFAVSDAIFEWFGKVDIMSMVLYALGFSATWGLFSRSSIFPLASLISFVTLTFIGLKLLFTFN